MIADAALALIDAAHLADRDVSTLRAASALGFTWRRRCATVEDPV